MCGESGKQHKVVDQGGQKDEPGESDKEENDRMHLSLRCQASIVRCISHHCCIKDTIASSLNHSQGIQVLLHIRPGR